MNFKSRRGWLLGLVSVWLFLFCVPKTYSQNEALDVADVFEQIKFESAVPGVAYIFYIHAESENPIPSLFQSSTDKTLWFSDTLNSYKSALDLQFRLSNLGAENYGIHYLLFDKEVEKQALAEYISSLLRNDLFQPAPSFEADVDGQLVVLGTKAPFKPFYRMKIKILNDIKVIILLASLILFVISSILLVLVMFVVKRNKHRKNLLTERFKSLSYEPLSTLMFEHTLEDIEGFQKSHLEGMFPKNHVKKSLFKDVMIQEIILLNKNMKGDFKLKLKLIYRKLDLMQHTLKKLKSNRWDIVTSGIVEINEMDVTEAKKQVLEFVNHSNFYVRSNAIATLLNIGDDTSLKVLADQNYPLSRWQQMKYYRIIRFINSKRPVQVNLLFESSNQSVRIYGYKLVRYLGLFEYLEKLKSIYPNAELEEKIEILNAYDAFSFEDAIDQIHADVFTDNPTLFIAIVKVLKNIGTTVSQAVLIERLATISDFEMKKCVLEAIYCLNPLNISEVFGNSEDLEIQRICNHLQDPILSNV